MNCKSCGTILRSTDKFCPSCGAKIVDDRLSMKGTWEEFVGPFFSWDNNYWRTFFGLFKNPKDVLEAYISGARKKYFQPFSYLILYATIAVLFFKVFPYDITEISKSFNEGYQSVSNNTTPEKMPFDLKAFYDNMFNYYNFYIILTIPFYSLLTYITFIKKGNNFAEHLVFNSYLQANIGYFSMFLQLLLLNIFHFPTVMTYIQLIFSIVYSIYVYKKLYSLNFKQTAVATLVFWLLAIGIFLLLTIVVGIFIAIKMLMK